MKPSGEANRPPDDPPLSELRSGALLAGATAVACSTAAGAEIWRYALLVQGRTQVLLESVIRISDALVIAAGCSALLLGALTALVLFPALGRLADCAAARAAVQPSRTADSRLRHLLIPGWNLYGAGVVLAEIDALVSTARVKTAPVSTARVKTAPVSTARVKTAPPGAQAAPGTPLPRTTPPLRWLRTQLPDVAVSSVRPAGPINSEVLNSEVVNSEQVHRPASRLVLFWWTAWIVNGLLAAAVLIGMATRDTLQAHVDLVVARAVLDLAGAVVAILTMLLMRFWRRALQPVAEPWPADWIVQPPQRSAASVR